MTIITNLDREENLTSVCSASREARSKIIEQIKKGSVLNIVELCAPETWSDPGMIARVGGYCTPPDQRIGLHHSFLCQKCLKWSQYLLL